MEKRKIKLLTFLFILTLCLLINPNNAFAAAVKKNLSNATITLSYTSCTYDATAKQPTVTVKYNGNKVNSSHYTVNYINNTNVGTATVTVTAKSTSGIYTGKKSATFKIYQRNLSNTTIYLSKTSYTYDSTEKKPAVTVIIGRETVPKNYYTLSYKNNVNAGTATVTIKGQGNLTGKVTKTYTINKKVINSNYTIKLSQSAFIYDGKAKKPTVELYNDGNWIMKEGLHYALKYENNVNTGTARVSAIGINNYVGKISSTFKICTRKQIVDYAKNFLGCPYKYGGASPLGFDCAGFTQYVYGQFGYSLPAGCYSQNQNGIWVSSAEIKEGDLIFFFPENGSPTHVGLYMGNGQFMHASSTAKCVTISSLGNGYNVYSARRIIH